MRASGILMPVFSLPGPFGIGTLGKEAFAFVDFLAEAKQAFWQILPIGPTGYGDSPYQSFSAFAGNPYFIDFRLLAADGLLTEAELPAPQPVGPVDYGALYQQRPVVLHKAADRLLASPTPAYEAFCEAQSGWLEDYALFMAVKAEQKQAGLSDWPDDLRTREPAALAAAKERLTAEVLHPQQVLLHVVAAGNLQRRRQLAVDRVLHDHVDHRAAAVDHRVEFLARLRRRVAAGHLPHKPRRGGDYIAARRRNDLASLCAQQSHVPHDDLAADGKPVRQRRRAERCVRLLQKGQNLLSALLRRHGCRLLTEK